MRRRMPDSPRQWTLWVCVEGCDYGRTDPANPPGALLGHELQPVQVVEESRLREVEAERDDWKRHFTNEQSESMRYRNWYAEQAAARNREVERADQAEARVERLEADLQEAREALEAIDLHERMPAGEEWDVAYYEVVELARGVLRKGDTDAG